MNWYKKNLCAAALILGTALVGFKPRATSVTAETKRVSDSVKKSDRPIDSVLNENVIHQALALQAAELNIPVEKNYVTLSKKEVLSDKMNRIHSDFTIPRGLEKRTEFWFDVYTKYSDKMHVIHHVLYPWVIYKVVDTTEIYNSELHKWTKYHKAKRVVAQETQKVRDSLRRLSVRQDYKRLTGIDREVFQALRAIPGPRKKVLQEARQNLRVQLGQRDFFLRGLTSSAKYLPYIESEFAAAGLPLELTRLPFVESSFNEKAHSKVGASGIWQIMPVTGRAYFRVDDMIDERNSPLKASIAAIEIFKSNYRQFKDWPLAVTAYNHGAGGLRQNLKNARATNLPDLVAKYHAGSFKFASANFYTSFLAALYAEKYHNEIFSADEIVKDAPMLHHIFVLKNPARINRVIQLAGIDKETFLTYNMDLRGAAKHNALLPRGHKLLLPPEGKRNLESNLGPALMREASAIKLPKRAG